MRKQDMEKLAKKVVELQQVQRPEADRFSVEVKAMVKEAETTRLRYMQARQNRGFVAMSVGLLSLLAGACGFGWFFLVTGDLPRAAGCVVLSAILPVFLYRWSDGPIREYIREHKRSFMPKMAKALGGFSYSAEGGIGEKILLQTGVLPQFDRYDSEDCFMGMYKGIKVILSESRLYRGNRTVFEGLFVLLEMPQKTLEGHTIITAHAKMAQEWAPTRWQKLAAVPLKITNPEWKRFQVFSDRPEEATLMVGDKLLKELFEASAIFKNAPLTAVLFRGSYIFMMIPNEGDMFEASDLYVPIPTSDNAQERRREVEKLLEIVDVFDIYKSHPDRPATAQDSAAY